jgi:S1-C subfamily serine protease
MKAMLSAIIAMFVTSAAFGAGLTSVVIDGNSYSNITKVYSSAGGRIIILYPGGGTSATADKVPADFLSSWMDSSALAGAKASSVATEQQSLDRAIRAGNFRDVDGVVYDLRKPQSGWVTFLNVKVLQVVDAGAGAIIDTVPDDAYSVLPIYIKNLPSVSDTDFISVKVLPDGTYSYINKNGDDRTIHAYDYGKICDRDDIPETVLSGQKPFDDQALGDAPQKDVVASLPDSGDLTASGSGFFVASGYLVTNHHVVKNARNVKVQTADGKIYPATVVRIDVTNDLALLSITGSYQALSISTADVQLGDSVFTIGFPDVQLQGTQPKYTAGTISGLSGLRDDPKDYQISVPVQPGNSGGPLVDKAGNVVGVIVARLDDFAALRSMGSLPQNVNYAVKGSLLRDFLTAGGEVDLTQPASAIPGSIVPSVQKSVALVLVY